MPRDPGKITFGEAAAVDKGHQVAILLRAALNNIMAAGHVRCN